MINLNRKLSPKLSNIQVYNKLHPYFVKFHWNVGLLTHKPHLDTEQFQENELSKSS